MKRIGSALLALSMVFVTFGCANQELEEELSRKDEENRSLANEVNRQREEALRAQAEREAMAAQAMAAEEKAQALAEAARAREQALAASQNEKRLYNELAKTERERAEQAAREAEAAREALQRIGSQPTAVVHQGPSHGEPQGAAAAVEPSRPSGQVHLRIIALPRNEANERAIQEIAEYMRGQGIEHVNARPSGNNHLVVDIGYFGSTRETGAVGLKEKVTGMKYQGVRQFDSAYFVTY